MDNNTNWIDDYELSDEQLARAARAEDEAEMALDPEPLVDRSGISPDCNESQPCRGDEPEEDDDYTDDDLASVLDDLPI